MNTLINHIDEQHAASAFSKQAVIFDRLYADNVIVQYKRKRVRDTMLQYLPAVGNMLELNAGTGDDAIFFAERGHHVHATDIAEGMQQRLMEKVAAKNLSGLISNELCSFTALNALKNKGPFDCIFSNFAGLNCTGELDKVLQSFNSLLKPGGIVVLVVLPAFCFWETALIAKGKFKTATRRFFSDGGRKAKIDGAAFTCWYYNPGYIIKRLRNNFELLRLEGLCTIVPPSYIEHFAEKHPGTFSRLCKIENKLKEKWPWKYIGDYYIISFRKK